MAVKKRGSRWHYAFMIKHKRYRGAIPEARTKDEAKRAETEIRRSVYNGTYGQSQGAKLLINYAMEVYLPWADTNKKSAASDHYHVRVFQEYFGDKAFAEFSRILIERFKGDRLKSTVRGSDETRQPSSVNRELACLSKIFSMAVIDGYATHNPCLEVRKLRENNKRERYLMEEEEARLLAALTGQRAHIKPLVLVALQTGARRGELLGLRRQDVNVMNCVIHFRNTKSGKDRSIPLSGETLALLREQLKKHPDSDLVFASPRGGGRITDVKRAFHAACKDAGIEDFHFHDLRHTFATRAAMEGHSATSIAKMLGHADLRMTARYAHATDRNLRELVESVGKSCHKIATIQKTAVG